ncbi:MAG: ABC transporter permease, partial [Clostridiales bacterium]|nr:ABC transporter permease [Clostridiales bacterium]
MNKKLFAVLKLLLPFVAIAISVLTYYKVEDNGKQKKTDHPYYLYFLAVIGAVILLEILIGLFNEKIRKRILYKAPFLTGVIVFLLLLNYITTKTTMLPTLYFPSL